MRNRTENKIKLILIRHGATAANVEHRYIGRTDERLSADGIQRLKRAKEMESYPKLEYLFSSPMKRCMETGQILYPSMEIIIIPEWVEIDFGAFEGKNYKELQGNEQYQAWIDSNGTLPFPEGESRTAFVERCMQGLCRMLGLLGELGKKRDDKLLHVGTVVHGGTIMALLSSLCGGDYFSYQVKNGAGYICTLESGVKGIRITEVEKLKGE